MLEPTQKSNYTLEEQLKKEEKDIKNNDSPNKRTDASAETKVAEDPTIGRPSKILERQRESSKLLKKQNSISTRIGIKTNSNIKEPTRKIDSGENTINIFVLPTQKPCSSVVEASETWTWLKVSEIFALFYILMDTFELHNLITYAVDNGGYIFLIVYFFVSILFELPYLNLFIHIGQFTRAGITKVFGLYAVIFRGMGWSLMVITIMYCASTLTYTGYRFSILFGAASNPYKLVDCTEYPDYDCGRPEVFNTATTCCSSIYNVVNCSANFNTTNSVFSVGSRCVEGFPEIFNLITARKLFRNENRDILWIKFASFGIVTAVTFILAIAASFGYTAFTYIIAATGILTLILYLIRLISTIVAGDIGKGFKVLSVATESENFFQIKMLFDMLSLLIYPLMKFGIISFASFRSTKFDSFYTVAPIVIARKVLMLLIILSTISMHGFFMNYPSQLKDFKLINMESEFFLSSGHSIIFYYLAIITSSVIEWARVAGIMYIAIGIQRDHLKDEGLFWKFVPTIGLAIAITVLNALLTIFENYQISLIVYYFMIPTGSLWICLIGICTIFLYGELEHHLDRAAGITSTSGKWSKLSRSIGAESLWYPHWIAKRFPQILIAVFSVDALIKLLHLRKSRQYLQLSTGYAVMFFPITVFFVYTALLIYKLRKETDFKIRNVKTWWRLVYPSVEHPAYLRILKHEKEDYLNKIISKQA